MAYGTASFQGVRVGLRREFRLFASTSAARTLRVRCFFGARFRYTVCPDGSLSDEHDGTCRSAGPEPTADCSEL